MVGAWRTDLFHRFGVDCDPLSSGWGVRRNPESDDDPALAVDAPQAVGADRALAQASLVRKTNWHKKSGNAMATGIEVLVMGHSLALVATI